MVGVADAEPAVAVVLDPKRINIEDIGTVNGVVMIVESRAYALSFNEGSAPEAMHVDLFTR